MCCAHRRSSAAALLQGLEQLYRLLISLSQRVGLLLRLIRLLLSRVDLLLRGVHLQGVPRGEGS